MRARAVVLSSEELVLEYIILSFQDRCCKYLCSFGLCCELFLKEVRNYCIATKQSCHVS